jgi:hypothetical protein
VRVAHVPVAAMSKGTGSNTSCAKSRTSIPETLSAIFSCQLDDGEVRRDFGWDGRVGGGQFGRAGFGWY